MSTNDTPQSRPPALLAVGDLVIMRDGRRGTIEHVADTPGEPLYLVRMADGSQRMSEADGLIRAKTYANWVAPGTGWDGAERRKAERRAAERRKGERRSPGRATPGRRVAERRKGDRRRP